MELKKLKSAPRSSPMKRSRGASPQIPGQPTGTSGSRSSPCTYPPPHTPMCPPSPPGRPWSTKEHCTTSMPAKTKKKTSIVLLKVLENDQFRKYSRVRARKSTLSILRTKPNFRF